MGKAARAKREGAPAEGRIVLWAVLVDGQMGSYLFPDMASARATAVRLRDERPASVVEYAQVGVQLLLRRPMRPKIDVVRVGAP